MPLYFEWDNIVESADWVKLVFSGAVFMIVLIVIYILDIRNQQEFYKKQNQDISLVQEEILQKERQVVQLISLQEREEMLEEEFFELSKNLPKQNEIPGLIEYISHIGIANGLTFESIDMLPEVSHDFYVVLPIHIALKGDYQQWTQFVTQVSSLPQWVTLHDFSLEKEGALLNISVTMKTYFDKYQQASDIQEGALPDQIASNSHSPFLSKKTPVEHDTLENIPLEKIKFTGILKNINKTIAILQTDNSKDSRFHPVTLGSRIGKNQGEIIFVGDSHLEIEEQFPDGQNGWKSLRILMEMQGAQSPE